MSLINPENKPHLDKKYLKVGQKIFRSDFHSFTGYEEFTIKNLSFKRVVSNDFGDYFEDDVDSIDQANWYDIEVEEGCFINPYDLFISSNDAQEHTLKELKEKLIPDTEKFIETYQKILAKYKKLQSNIKEDLDVRT